MSSVLLVLSVFNLVGCGSDSGNGPEEGVTLKLNLELETPALASLVEVVTLTLRYGSTSISPDTLNLEDGVIADTVSVAPGDSVTFIVRALDEAGRTLYEGRDGPRRVQPGSTLVLDILLRPSVLMLRASPLIQSIEYTPQGLVEVHIDVYNVDSLSGAAFRVRYDTSVLDFNSAVEGNFLSGPGTPIPTLALVVKDSANFVAYAVTRVREPNVTRPGAATGQTPGRLATFRFTKKRAGESSITIDPTSELVNRFGEPVPGHADLIRESATVRILANP